MADANLNVAINATENTRSAFRTANSRLERLDRKAQQLQSTFKGMALGGGIPFAGLTFGLTKAVQAAGRAQEVQRSFNAVFVETRDTMEQWAETVAREYGRVETNVRKLAATTGGVLKPAFDFTNEQLAKMTQGLGEAAVAMQAYDPRIDTAQQAMEGFTQALIGNRQRVLEWGFQVGESQLKTKALEMGITETKRALTQQEEALVTYRAILNNTSIAQDVLAKSQQDWSQQTARLRARFQNFGEVLGRVFLDQGTSFIKNLRQIIDSITAWIKENPVLTRMIVGTTVAVTGLTTALGVLGLAVTGVIRGLAGLAALNIGRFFSILTTRVYASQVAMKVTALTTIPNLRSAMWRLRGAVTALRAAIGSLTFGIPIIIGLFTQLARKSGGVIDAFRFMGLELQKLFAQLQLKIAQFFNWLQKKIPGMEQMYTQHIRSIRANIEGLNREQQKIVDNAQEAKDKAKQSFKGMEQSAKQTANQVGKLGQKVADLRSSFIEDDRNMRQKAARRIAKEEKEVRNLEEKLEEARSKDRSAQSADRIDKLQQELGKKRAALQEAKNMELATERDLQKARKRMRMTEFQRFMHDLKERRKARRKEFLNKLKQMKEETKTTKTAEKAQTGVVQAAQQAQQRAVQETTKKTKQEFQRRVEAAKDSARRISEAFENKGRVSGSTPATLRTRDLGAASDTVLKRGLATVNVNVTGNSFLSEDAPERMSDMIMDRLNQEGIA